MKSYKILDNITDIKIIQAAQAKDLENHMMRTDHNEYRINLIEGVYEDLKSHLLKVSGAISLAKWVGGCLGFVYLISQLYDRFM